MHAHPGLLLLLLEWTRTLLEDRRPPLNPKQEEATVGMRWILVDPGPYLLRTQQQENCHPRRTRHQHSHVPVLAVGPDELALRSLAFSFL